LSLPPKAKRQRVGGAPTNNSDTVRGAGDAAAANANQNDDRTGILVVIVMDCLPWCALVIVTVVIIIATPPPFAQGIRYSRILGLLDFWSSSVL
jgi:hypothetical protein